MLPCVTNLCQSEPFVERVVKNLYIDATVDALNSTGDDGWLSFLHCLLQVDDTIIFATSREQMIKKLQCLKQTTDSLDMVMHPIKSKLLAINAEENEDITIDNVYIARTESYIYLGTPILNASAAKHVQEHIQLKSAHVHKFTSFLAKNNDAPFQVKEKVMDDAVSSGIFYSCETWLTDNLKSAETPYLAMLKQMLDVRQQTPSALVLLELGKANAASIVRDKQTRFLQKLERRDDYIGSYIHKTIEMAVNVQSPMGKVLQNIGTQNTSHKSTFLAKLTDTVKASEATRNKLYCEVNPTLQRHSMYDSPKVPEWSRKAFTRVRLSSHRLNVEMGRWTRIPREDRHCSCSSAVQTELHVLLYCPLTVHQRQLFPEASRANCLAELFDNSTQIADLACFCYKVLEQFS